jgi:hypothetical protein
MPDTEIALLLDLLDEAFDTKSWHGPNLRGAIRGLTAHQAGWRPTADGHNIWELVLHAAYWKYRVRRSLTGEKRGSFPLPGSNYFARPLEESEKAWKQDTRILVDEHAGLRAAVAAVPLKLRNEPKKWRTTLQLVRGAAAHDLYHAGQIRLLRRLSPGGGH